MATCNSYNCLSLGTYNSTLDNCSPIRTGGIFAALLIDCGITVSDPTDGTELNTLIGNDQAWLVENVKIGIAAGTPVTVDPVTACGTPRVVKNTYTGTIFDAKLDATNNDFWNQLTNGRVIGGMILPICTTDGLSDIAIYIDAEISFSGGPVIPDVNTDITRFEISFTWNSVGYDVITAATGVWD